MSMVTLRNLTEQEFPVPNTEFSFGPAGSGREDLALPERMAVAVLTLYGSERFEKVELGDIGHVYKQDEAPTTMWVANITGNPDAPDVVTAGKRLDKNEGRMYDVKVENVNRQPRHIKYEKKGAQGHYVDRYGAPWGFNKLPTIIDLPPFKRRELVRPDAKWVLGPESGKAPYERGAIIQSRPRSDFEPDIKWSLDDLRAYLGYVDPAAKRDGLCGPAEEDLQKKYTVKKKLQKDSFDMAVANAKKDLIKRLHFRVVDPKYRLPTKQEFELHRSGMSTLVMADEPEDMLSDYNVADEVLAEL